MSGLCKVEMSAFLGAGRPDVRGADQHESAREGAVEGAAGDQAEALDAGQGGPRRLRLSPRQPHDARQRLGREHRLERILSVANRVRWGGSCSKPRDRARRQGRVVLLENVAQYAYTDTGEFAVETAGQESRKLNNLQ